MTVMADFGILENQITIRDIVEISSETKGDICQIIDIFLSDWKYKKQEFSRFKTKQIMLYHYHRKYDQLVAQVCKNKQKYIYNNNKLRMV